MLIYYTPSSFFAKCGGWTRGFCLTGKLLKMQILGSVWDLLNQNPGSRAKQAKQDFLVILMYLKFENSALVLFLLKFISWTSSANNIFIYVTLDMYVSLTLVSGLALLFFFLIEFIIYLFIFYFTILYWFCCILDIFPGYPTFTSNSVGSKQNSISIY